MPVMRVYSLYQISDKDKPQSFTLTKATVLRIKIYHEIPSTCPMVNA